MYLHFSLFVITVLCLSDSLVSRLSAKINETDTFGPGDDDEIQFDDIGDDDEDIDDVSLKLYTHRWILFEKPSSDFHIFVSCLKLKEDFIL